MRIGIHYRMRSLSGNIRACVLLTFGALVASCASVDPGAVNATGAGSLQPVAQTTTTQAAPTTTTQQVAQTTTSRRGSNAPYKGDAAIFAFQPMKGAPSEMIFMLEDLIVEEAKVRKINLVDADDPSATYLVRGKLSALGDSHNVIMVYVWDIYDRSGQRLKRISGQEVGTGSDSDPWSAIGPENMEFAAQSTVDSLATWIRP